MSNPHESLATGVKATHIGPETGGTGTATAGEGSSAGTREQGVPAAASGLESSIPTAPESDEARSFKPAGQARADRAPNAPIDDASADLRDIVDGADRPKRKH